MSSLNVTEQRYIEKVLDMGTGYTLDFTDATETLRRTQGGDCG